MRAEAGPEPLLAERDECVEPGEVVRDEGSRPMHERDAQQALGQIPAKQRLPKSSFGGLCLRFGDEDVAAQPRPAPERQLLLNTIYKVAVLFDTTPARAGEDAAEGELRVFPNPNGLLAELTGRDTRLGHAQAGIVSATLLEQRGENGRRQGNCVRSLHNCGRHKVHVNSAQVTDYQ